MNFDLNSMMSMLMNIQMMKLVMGPGGLMSGLAGGGSAQQPANSNGLDGAGIASILESSNDKALLAALNTALANTSGLGAGVASGTAGDAIQGGLDIAHALVTYITNAKNNALIQAVTDQSAGSQTAVLAIALAA